MHDMGEKMTIIEFFDKASIENIAGALLCEPKQVILIGDKRKQLERTKSLYQSILVKNNIPTEISYRSVNKNNLQDIISTLEQVIEDCEDCVFDLTGGEEMYLVAVGTIMERYKGRVQCHRFNFKNDTLNDCDADGNVSVSKSFDISIEDNISIYGGEIVMDSQREIYTYPWDFNEDFQHDIETMWDICRKNTRLWNAHVGTIGAICELFEMQDTLSVSFDKELAISTLKQRGIKFVCVAWIMYELQKHGLIRSLTMQDTISFVFKNEQVKQCLTIAGQILELAVAKTMRSIKDKNGAPLYHDVKVGVVIDWDRAEEDEEYRTINEIDVVAMKGSIPIFISCKNGDFDANELYKLNTVAEHFGNKYSKKVLISTELDKLGEKSDYIRARMDDMGIRSVENVDEMNDSELERVLKSLWSN